MPGDINRITIIGRLTRDPELKYIQSGTAVSTVSIANNQKYNGKDTVSYYDVTLWGKLAENVEEYMSKGSRIAVDGKLQQRRWEDQNGNKRSKVEIVAESVQFLDSRNKESVPSDDNQTVNSNPFDDPDIPF